jgi:plastocyanin
MKARRMLSALALAAGFGLSSVCLADISGTVKFDGEAPEPAQIDMSAVKECASQHPDGAFDESLVVADGKLANVVVSVKADNLQGEKPSQPATLDQKGCQYHPHVIAVMVGQDIIVKNDDNFLHNVHALSIDNPAFNFGQPTKDPNGRKVEPMKTAERFKVKCDVHPWMGAHVAVFEHPYFGVSKEDGTFKIPGNLPDGEYTLVAWHEKLGEQEAKVMVSGGKAENADFTFKPAAAKADDAANPAAVKLASLEAKTSAKGEAACCEVSKAKTLKVAVKAGAKPQAEQPQAAAK